MEIRRFGIGHRRREGPPGSRGVVGQVIHADANGHVAELAFARGASLAPHANPNMTWFLVIEGGGFVQVGDERARVAVGEAVLWPPDVVHAAWTDQTTMRAIVVELPPDSVNETPLLLEGRATVVDVDSGAAGRGAGGAATAGGLAPKPPVTQSEHRSAEEEPW